MRSLFFFLILSIPAARAEPAMWLVQSPTAKIYLFGTMHILPTPVDWFSPKIAAALNDSAVLIEEVDIRLAQTDAMNRIIAMATSSDTDLWQILPKASAEKFRKLIKACHLPASVVAHMRPWFATFQPEICEVMKATTDQNFTTNGPEAVLATRARQAGKRVEFFETAEEQISAASSAPINVQIAALEQSIDEADKNPTEVADVEKTWFAGNVDAIAKDAAAMRAFNNDMYVSLFVNRNIRFARRIAALLQGHETIFVAIGAGHLTGPDSVQAQLQKQNIPSKRM
jgi:uncharacterized protein YbaP (TraB family)